MKTNQVFAAALTLALLSVTGMASAQQHTVLPVQGSVGDVEFPNRDRSYLRKGDKGSFVNVDNLRQMKAGLAKQQVRELLGAPHFSEGLMGVSKWNYVFNFRTGAGDEFITCQYQVVYGKTPYYAVESMHWDGPDCLALLNRQPSSPVVSLPSPPSLKAQERMINLSADALFKFNQSAMGDVLPKGRADIEALAATLIEGSPSVHVIGYTDRLGSDAYNQALSERRAATIRNLMISLGVAPQNITSEGRGESEPTTTCSDKLARKDLIACLKADRRVQITVRGTQPIPAS